ncbi:hypothetical protein [Planotetraspora mira]|jgi:hypothetical protein|uniref:Ribosomal protein L7/L12 C-terminal domain-containing protein n=1 Tax=Planotetraspora mira TaxID=58121 RepID=A0A8J3TKM5_9ACTN|nr:hypothetical protein [Planotetraspora mira]GII27481.1 hypothetical protein Pmi06nite_09230 [Planotetraspora mira]
MAGIGAPELVIIVLVLALAGSLVGFVIFMSGRAARARRPFDGSVSHGSFDLATKVRGLKSQGRYEQAVLLVRGETGFGEEEARSFVDRA